MQQPILIAEVVEASPPDVTAASGDDFCELVEWEEAEDESELEEGDETDVSAGGSEEGSAGQEEVQEVGSNRQDGVTAFSSGQGGGGRAQSGNAEVLVELMEEGQQVGRAGASAPAPTPAPAPAPTPAPAREHA